MARCSSCNKFVSNGDPEVEIQSGDEIEAELIDGKLIIKASPEVRVMIPCGECGQDLKEASFSFEIEEEHSCDKLPKKEPEKGFIVEGSIDVEPINDFKTVDRKGKPIKNPRYQTHLYGVEVVMSAMCPFCGDMIDHSEQETIKSSSMDECG